MPKGANFIGKRPEGAGRKPGTPNKLTSDLRAMIKQEITQLTADMIELAKDPETKHEIRVKIWEVALRKTLPDLTATTLNPDADGNAQPIQLVVPALDKVDHNGNPLT